MKEVHALWAMRILLCLIWSSIVFVLLRASFSDNPLPLSTRARAQIFMILPEGWAFFTRDPREPRTRVYLRSGEGWRAVVGPPFGASTLFGARRSNRTTMIEAGHLEQQLPREAWLPCEVEAFRCSLVGWRIAEVNNVAVAPALCGELLIERRPLVPWAWSSAREPVVMPGEVAWLEARC